MTAYFSITRQAFLATVMLFMLETLCLSDFKVLDWFWQADIPRQDICLFFFFLSEGAHVLFEHPYLPLGL